MTTAISPSRVARIFGLTAIYRNLAPSTPGLAMRIMVVARGNTAATFVTTPTQVFTQKEAGDTYGYGSPIHQIVDQLLPESGDGVGDIPVTVYPLPDGSAASAGDITPSGTTTAAGSYRVKFNNRYSASFTIPSGSNVAAATALIHTAISGMLNAPVTSVDNGSDVGITAKWQGTSGDNITVAVEGPSVGMTFGYTQPTAGGGVPTDVQIQTLLAQVGSTHETIIVQEIGNDTTMLDELAAWDEGRWDAEVLKPLVMACYGSAESTFATAITVPDARTIDRTNVQLMAPGSDDLPWEIAARQAARVALRANSASPARAYDRMRATGLTPGAANLQWTSAQRDTAVKAGCSTIEVEGGEVRLSDIVTFYHPVGDATPAFRYVVDKVKILNIINDVKSAFSADDWAGAPLVPDGQVVDDSTAKSPSMAVGVLSTLMTSWGRKALISDPDGTRSTIAASIDGANPKRLNTSFNVQVSGNTKVISSDMFFGFFYGQAA